MLGRYKLLVHVLRKMSYPLSMLAHFTQAARPFGEVGATRCPQTCTTRPMTMRRQATNTHIGRDASYRHCHDASTGIAVTTNLDREVTISSHIA